MSFGRSERAGVYAARRVVILKAPLATERTNMTAAILAFPTPFDRDQSEFTRNGASNYTRAFGDARSLWASAVAGEGAERLAPRIEILAAAIVHLGRYRPEALGEMVIMAGGAKCELRIVPDVLRAWGAHR